MTHDQLIEIRVYQCEGCGIRIHERRSKPFVEIKRCHCGSVAIYRGRSWKYVKEPDTS